MINLFDVKDCEEGFFSRGVQKGAFLTALRFRLFHFAGIRTTAAVLTESSVGTAFLLPFWGY